MICRHGYLRFLRLAHQHPQVRPTSSLSTFHALHNSINPPNPSEAEQAPPQPDALPTTPPEPDTLPTKVRHLMRQVPHNLTAITAHDPHRKVGNGFLASSFTTITLVPTPFVSFNIQLPSTTYDTIRAANGLFTASGLNDSKTAQALAKISRNAKGEPINVRNLMAFSGRLRVGMGGVWWMRCKWLPEKCVEVGDHMVVVAEVLAADRYKDNQNQEERALVYVWGKFMSVHPMFRFVSTRDRAPGGPRLFRVTASRDHLAEAQRPPGRRVKTLVDLL